MRDNNYINAQFWRKLPIFWNSNLHFDSAMWSLAKSVTKFWQPLLSNSTDCILVIVWAKIQYLYKHFASDGNEISRECPPFKTYTHSHSRVNGLLKTKICRQQSTQLTKARRHNKKKLKFNHCCTYSAGASSGQREREGWQNPPIIALQFWHSHRRRCWVSFFFRAHSLYFLIHGRKKSAENTAPFCSSQPPKSSTTTTGDVLCEESGVGARLVFFVPFFFEII